MLFRSREREAYAKIVSICYGLFRALDNMGFLRTVDAETIRMTDKMLEKEREQAVERVYSLLHELFDIQGEVLLFSDKDVIHQYNKIRSELASLRQHLHEAIALGPQHNADMSQKLFQFVNMMRGKLGFDRLPDLEGPSGNN